MKKFIFCTVTVFSLICFIACNQSSTPASNEPVSQDSLIKRGEYLVTTMGCDDCHSPKKMGPNGPMTDMDARFGGHVAASPVPPRSASAGRDGWVLFSMDQTMVVGPWGVSYSANISSDTTGIGTWSEKQFGLALRKGKYKGLENARELLPPMPWRSYQNLTDEDLKAIYTFLKNTKPVKNLVPPAEPPTGAPAGAPPVKPA